ncbi:MAG: class I SAM-dependent methyltransferase [Nitrospirota bacterium]|nr:class I SAM-dependent methyltransferase [Nitrospirota bacterium]
MPLLALIVTHLAKVAHWMGRAFEGAALLLTDMLPALMSPATLTKLVRTHYERSYNDADARFTNASQGWPLEQWEEEVLARHHIVSGKLLVLGTGIGRESIALANRGFRVIGLDISRSALRIGAQITRTAGVSVMFVQADFLAMPTHPAHLDYILLPSIMYSSIPSRSWRQTWLRQLIGLLSPEGLAILQFLVESAPLTRRKRTGETINRWLTKLPGANRLYQPGDTCPLGHFLHAFQDEQELRRELSESGVVVRELNWSGQYVVVAAPPTARAK